MERVVDVDADPAVQMLLGIDDPVRGLRRPELGDGHRSRRRQPRGEPPGGLPRGQTDRLDVDVGVGGALVNGLEARDRTVELLATDRVLGRHPERPVGDAELHGAEPDERAREHPPDVRLGQALAGGAVEDEPRERLAVRRQLALEGHAAPARVDEEDTATTRGYQDAGRQVRRRDVRLDAVEPPPGAVARGDGG